MSSKPAAIPLFADAYLADTMHLNTEEHGAYLLLLMAAWRSDDCSLANDDRKLARITGLSTRKWNSIKGTILEFWTVENDRIFNPRLRKEKAYVRKKSNTNRQNSEKRWKSQDTENIEDGGMRSECGGNAPPPPPIEEPKGSPNAREPDRTEEVFAHWQSIAVPAGCPAIQKITPKRRQACKARLRDDGLEDIKRAIDRIPASDFLTGRRSEWRADIEFLLRPDSVTKILEGKYDNTGNGSRGPPATQSATPFLDQMRRKEQMQ
jgi:uncharacterized protein YdaU (DUF1376 family)